MLSQRVKELEARALVWYNIVLWTCCRLGALEAKQVIFKLVVSEKMCPQPLTFRFYHSLIVSNTCLQFKHLKEQDITLTWTLAWFGCFLSSDHIVNRESTSFIVGNVKLNCQNSTH